MSGEETLVLEDVIADLIRVVGEVDDQFQRSGSASYESVQKELSGKLQMHILSYLRFLEGEDLLTYDRITDEIRITDLGRMVRSTPEELRGAARAAFGDQLGEESEAEEVDGGSEAALEVDGAFSEMFDDMAAEMDSAFDPREEEAQEEGEAPGVGFGNGASFESSAGPTPQEASVSGWEREDKDINGVRNGPAPEMGSSASSSGGAMQEKAFEREEELGSGGIGTVYRGRQVRLNREVAIKEVREIFNVFAGVQRQDILARFEKIIQTQASLLHANIIQVIDVDISGEYPFAVMQFAPNGNLRRLIDHGDRPPLAVALKYFLQILHALNTAHDQGVVHGSLKPENVVLDQAGNALVTDFGISRIVERDGGRGNQVYVGVGTVAYMSPEQFQDPNLATVRSDIYSLGIMFYEMLTGKVPGRRSPMPSSFYPDIPRALDDIFDRMSMDREEDRYESVADIITDIYAAEDVVSILDKRSGVLFLRDPMLHGELGLGAGVTVLADEISSGSQEWSGAATSEASLEDYGDFGQEEAAVEEVEAASFGVGEGLEDSEVEEEEEEELSVEGGVLDKLDKYGELFEDD